MTTPNIKLILNAVHQYAPEVIAVGGCVRDMLLNREPHDIDVASAYTPSEIKELLPFDSYDTGIEHGTVTFIIYGVHVEHTTFRKDVSTDGRRATVEFTKSFYEDAQRRDFTINAMGFDGTKVLDWFGGQSDLENNILKTVGNPYHRFEEDYLRVIRAFRFYVKYGLTFDASTKLAIEKILDTVKLDKVLSMERILDEFAKCITTFNFIPKVLLHNVGFIDDAPLTIDDVQGFIDHDVDASFAFLFSMFDDSFIDSLPIKKEVAQVSKFYGNYIMIDTYVDSINESTIFIWQNRRVVMNNVDMLSKLDESFVGIVQNLHKALGVDYPKTLVGAEIGKFQRDTFLVLMDKLTL
jgi:hypothetical protein